MDVLLAAAMVLRIYADVPMAADVETVKTNLVAAARAAGCEVPRVAMYGKGPDLEILVDCPDRPQEAGDGGRRD